ncbi:MAG: translation elongation factor Ts [Thermoguttaceae bacterium]|nr:translation elongation factor Ts [Thermoguttaceae bacterium]MDW8079166.1 translation elongation factor Ts [Thermoguttaceae bacterium]
MPEITAAMVKALRDRTGLPMMECKQALIETGGDPEAAIEWLRKSGRKTMAARQDRETSAGRIVVYVDPATRVGAMLELFCETAPVANNEQFINLASELVRQLACGPGADSPEALLSQPIPSDPSRKLQDLFEEVNIRIREVFRIGRMLRWEGVAAGYAHHDGTVGVLLAAEGGDPALAKDICMHIAAMRPQVVSRNDLDPQKIEKEREILTEQARAEGRPENVLAKVVEGRLRTFFAECCLLDQPFVKGSSDKDTVGDVAKKAGMKIHRFVRWVLGKE